MSRNWKLILTLGAIAATALASVPSRAIAAGDGRIEAGLKLSHRFCEQCHMVVPSTKQGWTDAPAFEAIANNPGQSRAKLVAFIERPHMHMLNTGRPPAESEEIAAYILSLRAK